MYVYVYMYTNVHRILKGAYKSESLGLGGHLLKVSSKEVTGWLRHGTSMAHNHAADLF